jgi:delta-aminolevulinic acid dehydratase/porphobilinogen synthase
LRDLVREMQLSPSDFIYPIFVTVGEEVRSPVSSMPGVFRLSINHAVAEAKRVYELGIPGVLLEALTGIRRAGADIIISYHAPDVARWLS